MPDTIDRLSLIAESLMKNAELVSAQMKSVTDQLHAVLMIDIEETPDAD